MDTIKHLRQQFAEIGYRLEAVPAVPRRWAPIDFQIDQSRDDCEYPDGLTVEELPVFLKSATEQGRIPRGTKADL